PGDAASLLRKTLAEVVSGASGGLLSIGVFAALWVASSGMLSIMTALNVASRVSARRSWWESRLVAVGLTIGFSLFTLTALLLLVFGGGIGEAVATRVARRRQALDALALRERRRAARGGRVRLCARRSGRRVRRGPARASADASRQRREDRDDVARGERTAGRRVLTVDEHDAREVDG